MSVERRFAVGAGRQRPAYEPKSLNCPNCGAGLTVQDEHAELVVCSSCQSHLDLSAGEIKALSQQKSDSDWGFQLSIGDPWVDGDHLYEVVARMVYAEEDQYITRQYLLFSPRLGSFWASEYEGAWSVSRPTRVLPESDPFSLESGGKLRTGNGRKWRKTEGGQMVLKWVEGALPWKAQIGDTLEYAEFSGSDRGFYEAQRIHNELEYGAGRKLTPKELFDATGIDPGEVDLSDSIADLDGVASKGKGCKIPSGCLVILLFVFGPIVAVPAFVFLGPIADYVVAGARDTIGERDRMLAETDALLKRLDDLMESSPGLLLGEEKTIRDALSKRRAALDGQEERVVHMQSLIDSDWGYNEDELQRTRYALQRAVREVAKDGNKAASILAYVDEIKKAPKAFTASAERHANLFRKDANRVISAAKRAISDWPERKAKIEPKLGQAQKALDKVESLLTRSRAARAAARKGDPDGPQMRAVLVLSNVVDSAKSKLKKLDLYRYVHQLYVSSETVLTDMNVLRKGDSLVFKHKLSTYSLQKGVRSSRPEVSEKWRDVSRKQFLAQQKNLGMAVSHKPLGRFANETVKENTVPGFAQICAPDCGNNEFGKWTGEADERHWEFLPAYAWIASTYWPNDFVITEAQYASWQRANSQKRVYLGQATNDRPAFFGSSAPAMLAFYAASLYVTNRGFNVAEMERRIAREVYIRQQSYRSSSSSGSRSGGGK